MTTLKELSIALGLMSSDHFPLGEANGWQDYVWHIAPVTQCISHQGARCEIVRSQWDWKRPQFYSYLIHIDARSNSVTATISLDNRDPVDTDDVCIVASFLNGEGEEIAISFVKWRVVAGKSITGKTMIQPRENVSTIATIAIGSKQCDSLSKRDSEIFNRLRTKLMRG